MLDIKLIRRDPEGVRAALARRGETADFARLLELDRGLRARRAATEALAHERKVLAEEIHCAQKDKRDAAAAIARAKAAAQELKEGEEELRRQEAGLEALLLALPNLPAPEVPEGKTAAENKVVRSWGKRRTFAGEPRPHWEIARRLGLVDFERGAKIAGSSFLLYTGEGARLVRALINFMLDLHTGRHGFTEVFPPFLVTRATMTGTGQLPRLENDLYRVERDDLFLIPTAEVPVTNIYAGEILPEDKLPLKLAAYSACFRREAGSHGQDVRGMIRLHQFDKVELVKFAAPEQAAAELESLVAAAEEVLRRLELEYRVLELCAGDLGASAARCFDLEAWAPGTGRFLEVSSCSWFGDFQARRANIRCRGPQGPPRLVHTLNGSGLALPRVIAALLENNQQEDGRVALPAALRPYLGGAQRLG